jgi:4-amino-4-deoxy-L-arabinose transferase-like glycosyltransferase
VRTWPRQLSLPRSFSGRLALIAVGALVIRAAYVLVIMPHVQLGPDATWYAAQSFTIAEGNGYVDPARFFGLRGAVATASFPPLWPSVLAVVNKLGAQSGRAFELTGAVVGTGTVVLTGLLGRRVRSPKVGLVAAALAAACPFLIAADGSLMSDSLFVLLITASVLLAYAASDKPTPVSWLVLGAVVGVAALARSDALVLGPLLIVAVAWRVRAAPWVRRITFGLLAVAAMVVVLLPWTIRNINALGDTVVLSNNSGSVLEGANCSATYAGKELGRWDPGCLRFVGQPGLSEAAAAREARDHAIRYGRDHLSRLPLVASVRALRVWGLYDPVRQSRAEAVESRQEDWQVVGWAYCIVLLPFAVAGGLLLLRCGSDLAPMLAVIAGVTLLAVLSWGNQRFRLPAEPVVLVLAAVGLEAAVVALTRRRRSDERDASRSVNAVNAGS